MKELSSTYIFSVNILSQQNYGCYGDLVVDGANVVRSFADGRSNVFGHSSNTVTMHCMQGQKVWVQDPSSGESRMRGYTYSTFTATLLHADQ